MMLLNAELENCDMVAVGERFTICRLHWTPVVRSTLSVRPTRALDARTNCAIQSGQLRSLWRFSRRTRICTQTLPQIITCSTRRFRPCER